MAKKKHYEIVTPDGTICPRCNEEAQKRKHIEITSKLLKQPYYYKYWYNCINPKCKTAIFMLEDWKIVNNNLAAKNLKIYQENQENIERISNLF